MTLNNAPDPQPVICSDPCLAYQAELAAAQQEIARLTTLNDGNCDGLRDAQQRIAELERPPDTASWQQLVVWGSSTGDAARAIQPIVADYCRMRERIAQLEEELADERAFDMPLEFAKTRVHRDRLAEALRNLMGCAKRLATLAYRPSLCIPTADLSPTGLTVSEVDLRVTEAEIALEGIPPAVGWRAGELQLVATVRNHILRGHDCNGELAEALRAWEEATEKESQ